jgi:hypothetical protein
MTVNGDELVRKWKVAARGFSQIILDYDCGKPRKTSVRIIIFKAASRGRKLRTWNGIEHLSNATLSMRYVATCRNMNMWPYWKNYYFPLSSNWQRRTSNNISDLCSERSRFESQRDSNDFDVLRGLCDFLQANDGIYCSMYYDFSTIYYEYEL